MAVHEIPVPGTHHCLYCNKVQQIASFPTICIACGLQLVGPAGNMTIYQLEEICKRHGYDLIIKTQKRWPEPTAPWLLGA